MRRGIGGVSTPPRCLYIRGIYPRFMCFYQVRTQVRSQVRHRVRSQAGGVAYLGGMMHLWGANNKASEHGSFPCEGVFAGKLYFPIRPGVVSATAPPDF